MLFDDPALRQLKQKFNQEKIRKEGTVRATDRGFGFLEASDKESYFITPNNMRSIMHGDRISAVIESDDKGKQQAVPEKLVVPILSRFVGRVRLNKNKIQVIPDLPNVSLPVFTVDKRQDQSIALKNGDWVICNLVKHALKDGNFKAELIERITDAKDPKVPWTVVLRGLDLPLEPPSFHEFTNHEADLLREDMTAIPFVTIDSAKTKDMDDALYIEKNSDNSFKLYVAIADPTAYIGEDSPLNKIAASRAFSIYLPGRDIPMLPRELSDDLCSLKENEERQALVGIIPILSDGTVDSLNTEFKLARIKSHGKLVYNYVSDFLEKGASDNFVPTDEIKDILNKLVEFAKLRDNYRSTHAASFKNRPDYDFVLTEDGALDHIEVNYRRIANQIVEEAMISANIAAGDILAAKFNAGVFNSHKGFDLSAANEILSLLESEGFKGADAENLKDMQEFSAIRRYANAMASGYRDARIRKLQDYSQISITPAPHFALGVNNYATWTSPIRKYGDMVNHRLLKALILHSDHPTLPDDATLQTMNQARRINRMAERDVKDWLYVDYLEGDIAKKTEFTGEIFDIVRGGLRVSLKENGAMIFIPASLIADNKSDVDFDGQNGIIFVGGKPTWRLSDEIKVRILSVNKETRSIVGAPTVGLPGVVLPNPDDQRNKR